MAIESAMSIAPSLPEPTSEVPRILEDPCATEVRLKVFENSRHFGHCRLGEGAMAPASNQRPGRLLAPFSGASALSLPPFALNFLLLQSPRGWRRDSAITAVLRWLHRRVACWRRARGLDAVKVHLETS